MFSGRSMRAKRALYDGIVDNLAPLGVPPTDTMIYLTEVPLENMAVFGARPASEVDFGFQGRRVNWRSTRRHAKNKWSRFGRRPCFKYMISATSRTSPLGRQRPQRHGEAKVRSDLSIPQTRHSVPIRGYDPQLRAETKKFKRSHYRILWPPKAENAASSSEAARRESSAVSGGRRAKVPFDTPIAKRRPAGANEAGASPATRVRRRSGGWGWRRLSTCRTRRSTDFRPPRPKS